MINILFVFIGSFVLDILWVLWVKKIGDSKAVSSAIYSFATVMLSGTIIVEYVGDPRLLLAAALGSFIGTYLTVKVSNDKKIEKAFRLLRIQVLQLLRR